MSKIAHKKLRTLFADFWKKNGHKEVPPISLVPFDDPTTLFTGSGMQQLVPFLLGNPHPLGKRLYNIQRCLRSQDIDEVGDNRHTTFFEMMGNWSLGDYFKKEQLNWFFSFLVDILGIDPKRLYVSVFAGDKEYGLERDDESIDIWRGIFKKYGITAELGERIFVYPAEKNWWSRAGVPSSMPLNEPGGPDSEVFYKFDVKHNPSFGAKCHPNCDCGKFLEIGNSVFMQYLKTKKGFVPLPNKNVDFGGGLERILAATCNQPDIFLTDLYSEIIKAISKVSGRNYTDNTETIRVIADHIKASVFLVKDGVLPSNKEQGYVLRRLLRRSAMKMHKLKGDFKPSDFDLLVNSVLLTYDDVYFNVEKDLDNIQKIINNELTKFKQALERGLKKVEKISNITGKTAFDLYQNYGFPLELTEEIFKEKGQIINRDEFYREFNHHKEISRKGSISKFKGGLADKSKDTVRYHTATHLLHQALFDVLGDSVRQEGSNITAERLRFDFYSLNSPTTENIKKVEAIVNKKIKEDLKVCFKIINKEEALKIGAKAFFKAKYPDKVKVYFITKDCDKIKNSYSKEFCGGPHVDRTSEIGSIKIYKFKKIGSNTYRIYAR